MDRISYARGALLGLACGDAGGTTLEFSRPGPFPWSPLLTGPHTEITGGGPFGVLPGQVIRPATAIACRKAGRCQSFRAAVAWLW